MTSIPMQPGRRAGQVVTNGPIALFLVRAHFACCQCNELGWTEDQMNAVPGDRLLIRRLAPHAPVRDGEILEVLGENGTPPYLVRWSDDGCVGLVFPGPDASVDHLVH